MPSCLDNIKAVATNYSSTKDRGIATQCSADSVCGGIHIAAFLTE